MKLANGQINFCAFRQFVEKAITKLRQKRVKVDAPLRIIDLQTDYKDWPACFKDLEAKKIQFVLYFDYMDDKTSHGTCFPCFAAV